MVNYELFTSGEMQWFGLEARCPAHGAPQLLPCLEPHPVLDASAQFPSCADRDCACSICMPAGA